MGIHKDWTKEDNIDFFFKSRKKPLDNFLEDFFAAIHFSSDGGRRFKKPGEALNWYLSRLSPEDAENIKKNLKIEHLNPAWNEYRKLMLDESLYNSKGNEIAKAIREQEYINKRK